MIVTAANQGCPIHECCEQHDSGDDPQGATQGSAAAWGAELVGLQPPGLDLGDASRSMSASLDQKTTCPSRVDQPTLGNISFDLESLASVMKRTSADRYNAAVATCEQQMHDWIIKAVDNQDMEMFGHARAALTLKEKLTAPRVRGYREDGSGGFTPIY